MCVNPVWRCKKNGRFYKNELIRYSAGKPYIEDDFRNLSGKYVREFSFDLIPFPCRKCVKCRAARSMQWGIRAALEMKDHKKSCFITLTYSDEFIPADRKLHYEHFQLFMKRLRERIKVPVRYIVGGELGDGKGKRVAGENPHWHICLFGWMPDDLRQISHARRDTYSSLISEVWPYGFNTVSELNIKQVFYAVAYSLEDGCISRFSLRPAIGRIPLERDLDVFGDFYFDGKKSHLEYRNRIIRQLDDGVYEMLAEERKAYLISRNESAVALHGDLQAYFEAVKNQACHDKFLKIGKKKL